MTTHDLSAIHPDQRYEVIKSQIRAADTGKNIVPDILRAMKRNELELLILELLREKQSFQGKT